MAALRDSLAKGKDFQLIPVIGICLFLLPARLHGPILAAYIL